MVSFLFLIKIDVKSNKKEMIKLSERPVKSISRYGSLLLFKNGPKDYVLAMAGEPIKRGESPVDIYVEEASKEEFNQALLKADLTDAYSHLLAEAFIQ